MSACIVGTSKCRLDVWQPKIYNATADPPVWYVPEKWVTCETNDDYTTNQRRSNAVTFVEIHDEIGAPPRQIQKMDPAWELPSRAHKHHYAN